MIGLSMTDIPRLLEGTHRLDSVCWRNQNARAQMHLQRLTLARGGSWHHTPPTACFPGGLTVTVEVGSHDTGVTHVARFRLPGATPAQAQWLKRMPCDTLKSLFYLLERRLINLVGQ